MKCVRINVSISATQQKRGRSAQVELRLMWWHWHTYQVDKCSLHAKYMVIEWVSGEHKNKAKKELFLKGRRWKNEITFTLLNLATNKTAIYLLVLAPNCNCCCEKGDFDAILLSEKWRRRGGQQSACYCVQIKNKIHIILAALFWGSTRDHQVLLENVLRKRWRRGKSKLSEIYRVSSGIIVWKTRIRFNDFPWSGLRH